MIKKLTQQEASRHAHRTTQPLSFLHTCACTYLNCGIEQEIYKVMTKACKLKNDKGKSCHLAMPIIVKLIQGMIRENMLAYPDEALWQRWKYFSVNVNLGSWLFL